MDLSGFLGVLTLSDGEGLKTGGECRVFPGLSGFFGGVVCSGPGETLLAGGSLGDESSMRLSDLSLFCFFSAERDFDFLVG